MNRVNSIPSLNCSNNLGIVNDSFTLVPDLRAVCPTIIRVYACHYYVLLQTYCTLIGFLILLNQLLETSSIIIGVLLGQQLFENLFLSFIEIIICCVVAQLLLSLVITRRIELFKRKIDQEMPSGKFLPKSGLYALLEAESSIKS